MSFQAYLDNIEAKTGKTPEEFRATASAKGLTDPTAKVGLFIDWRATDDNLGHGHAMSIVAYLRGKKD